MDCILYYFVHFAIVLVFQTKVGRHSTTEMALTCWIKHVQAMSALVSWSTAGWWSCICSATGKTSPWSPSTAWWGCRRGSKEERVGWAGQQSRGKREASSAGVPAARPQYKKERLWIYGLDSLSYHMCHDRYFSVLNCVAFDCLLLWFWLLTTVSFQKTKQSANK